MIREFELLTTLKRTSYLIRDHQVFHVCTMPAMAFLELILSALKTEGHSVAELELRHVLFERALTTDGTRDHQLRITLERASQGGLITVRSREARDGRAGGPDWSVNCRCELHQRKAHVLKTLLLDELKQEAIRTEDIDQFYRVTGRAGIVHDEFMKGAGECYVGEDYLLAEVRLSKLAERYRRQFYVHPAYLDCSTFFPLYFHATDGRSLYVPFYIESFRAFAAPGERCFVYVQRPSDFGRSLDILSNDYEIYTCDGRLAFSLKKYSAKRIRPERATIDSARVDEAEAVTAGPSATDDRAAVAVAAPTGPGEPAPSQATPEASIQWDLCELVGQLLDRPPEAVSPEAGFYDLGLESSDLLTLVRRLEAKLGVELYPTLLFEYDNIRRLADYLKSELGGADWVKSQARLTTDPATKEPADDRRPAKMLLHGIWEEAEDPKDRTQDLGGPMLVFDVDRSHVDSLRASAARHRGQQGATVLVTPGRRFQAVGALRYEIRPGEQEDYARLLQSLRARRLVPRKIVHFWSRAEFQSQRESTDDHLNLGIYSALFLSQALMREGADGGVMFLYLFDSPGGDRQPSPSFPFHAAMGGFAQTVRRENPKFVCRVVEIHGDSCVGTGGAARRLAETCLREFRCGGDDVEVRYESNRRLVRRFRRIGSPPLPGADEHGLAKKSPGIPWRENGVYLITGGLGALGSLFAEHLARGAKAGLILAGRTRLDEAALGNLRRLTALGSEVVYVETDLSKREDVKKLVAEAKRRFKRLNGIVHCAGVVRDSLIANKNRADVESVLGPKISGTVYLDELTSDEPLDFFAMFSSLSALIGNVGQADYAFANRFMDHFAAYREGRRLAGRRSGKTLSINWPYWADGGIRLSEEDQRWMKEHAGMGPLRAETGLAAFEEALRCSRAQVAVLEGDPQRIHTMLPLAAADHAGPQRSEPAGKGGNQRRPTPAAAPASRPRRKHSGRAKTDGIAVIGLGGRYPMANNLRELWDNLTRGEDCITEIPRHRWDYHQYFDLDRKKLGRSYSKWGGFLDDVDKFDPTFFGITPKVAVLMDPQERLFLETAWETVEDAGYTRATLGAYNVGVYVGVMWGQYQLYEMIKPEGRISPASFYASIANWVSYLFDFHGPSMALDTMCSSSLTAIILACEHIQSGAIDMALAGGVNLTIHPNKYSFLSMGRMLSSDGRCRSFGKGGDGYIPGEGVGAVLLKRLSRAVEDRDHIYGVVIGGSLNHGGKTSGFSVPNPKAQANLVRDVFRKEEIDPRTISYVEAHGTGTSLGDPIEIEGLTKAFRSSDPNDAMDPQYCSIGSVKSNIGHPESAAGIAGLTKVLLQMKHKKLVPSIHAEQLNPNIPFEESYFHVQTQLEDWRKPTVREDGQEWTCPRRAGVSSFGAGGANAHLLVEEYQPDPSQRTPARDEQGSDGAQVIVLSAKNEERLRAYAERVLAFLRSSAAGPRSHEEAADGERFERVRADLLASVSAMTRAAADDIRMEASLDEIGLDEVRLAPLLGEMYGRYGVAEPVPPYPGGTTVRALVQRICEGISDDSSVGETSRSGIVLRDLAYTLQVGREAMRERLAIVASTIGELTDKLAQYCDGKGTVENVCRGKVKSTRSKKGKKSEEQIDVDLVRKVTCQRELGEIARLWASGAEIAWEDLYPTAAPKRISLPTYPFAREQYWIPLQNGPSPSDSGRDPARLHPLIDEIVPTVHDATFRKVFCRSDTLVRDHRVSGRHVVPGVCHLEMARPAGSLVSRDPVNRIRRLYWVRPIPVEDREVEVQIRLFSNRDALDFRGSTDGKICSKGKLYCGTLDDRPGKKTIDLNAIREECAISLPKEEVYEEFTRLGLSYGQSLQGLAGLWGGNGEALGEVRLSAEQTTSFPGYVLHPTIADSALQGVIGCGPTPSRRQQESILLPYSIDELRIYDQNPLREICYVYCKRISEDPERKSASYAVKILDERGGVLIDIRDFCIRAIG